MCGLYKPRTHIGKYYVILFSLPKWQYLTLSLLVISLLLLLTTGVTSYPLLINALLVFLYTRIYAVLHKETVFYKTKRSLGLALAVLVYSSLLLLFTKNAPLIITSSATLTIVVILGLDGAILLSYLPAILPQVTTLITMTLLDYIVLAALTKWLLVLVLIVLIDAAIYMYMSRRKLGNASLLDLGTLFLRNWLDKRTEIEEVFSKIGEDATINPRIIELGDLLIIYTDVHYGPFSNIGSSRLPGLLTEEFKRLGKHVVALHGLGSHDRNIVSSAYIAKYRESILNEYLSGNKVKLLYHGGFCSDYYEWRLCGVIFDKLTLIFISRPYTGIDDVPYSIQLEYDLKARKLGLGELILVDSHNWELQKPLELDKLREALDNALNKIREIKQRSPVEILHRHVCFKTKAHGLIDGDMCILCIESVNRERFCLIYTRGNNMKPRVRDLILEYAKPLSTELIEAITNDEHSETGIRASITYIPLHESTEMLKAIQEKSLELSSTQPKREAWLYVLRFNTKLMGEAAIHLEELLESSIREAAALLLSYVFLTPLILQLIATTTGIL